MDLILLKPIETPRTSIKLYMDEDKELVIPQNNLTVAIGYNKFLSLKSSRLGQFCDKANAVKKIGNRNMLKLDKVVKVVLPAFLKGYFREFNGQPSRQNFCKINPKEIYHNAEIVLKILKEQMYMSYNPNSIEGQKGDIGEAIVQKYLHRENIRIVHKPDKFPSGASIFDFAIFPATKKRYYVEVKTQTPFNRNGTFTFSFPKERIDNYIKKAEEKGFDVELHVVEPVTGKVFFEDLSELMQTEQIDGTTYPITDSRNKGKDVYYIFALKQFHTYSAEAELLTELRKLYGITEPNLPVYDDEPPEELPLESAKQIPETTVPQPAETTETTETPANEPEPQLADEKQLPDITLSDCLERIATATKVDAKYIRELILDFRKNVFEHEQNELRLALLG